MGVVVGGFVSGYEGVLIRNFEVVLFIGGNLYFLVDCDGYCWVEKF